MTREETFDLMRNLGAIMNKLIDKCSLSMAEDLYLHFFLRQAIKREDNIRIYMNLIQIRAKMSTRQSMTESEHQYLIAYIDGFLIHAHSKLEELRRELA